MSKSFVTEMNNIYTILPGNKTQQVNHTVNKETPEASSLTVYIANEDACYIANYRRSIEMKVNLADNLLHLIVHPRKIRETIIFSLEPKVGDHHLRIFGRLDDPDQFRIGGRISRLRL